MTANPVPIGPSTLRAPRQHRVPVTVMKDVVSHFASGVVAVTGMEGAVPIGFTCQSFVSLSLDPPLISICPAATSTTWPRLRDLGQFCVNVLSDEQQQLSATFARPGIDRFASVDWRRSPAGAPLLEGVCAWLDCELWREYDGGDHTIVVGRVTGMGTGPGRAPLLFHRGRYGIQAVHLGPGNGEGS